MKEKFNCFNSKATNTATIGDCVFFIHNLLIDDSDLFKIEITELCTGRTYTRLYNSGSTLDEMFKRNINKSINIKAYMTTKNDVGKLTQIVEKVFNLKSSTTKSIIADFDLLIVDSQTKRLVNSKNSIRKKNKVSETVKKEIVNYTHNFIEMHRLYNSNKSSQMMYHGKCLGYFNTMTKTIDRIYNLLENKITEEIQSANEKTVRSYIGKELRDSPYVVQNIIFHDISTNITKGSSKWIGILNRTEY